VCVERYRTAILVLCKRKDFSSNGVRGQYVYWTVTTCSYWLNVVVTELVTKRYTGL
jgi:hypothetical protein